MDTNFTSSPFKMKKKMPIWILGKINYVNGFWQLLLYCANVRQKWKKKKKKKQVCKYFYTNTRGTKKLQMTFQPEHIENISYIYVVNQTFVNIWEINSEKNWPFIYVIVFMCISFCFVDKQIAHCCFSTNNIFSILA